MVNVETKGTPSKTKQKKFTLRKYCKIFTMF